VAELLPGGASGRRVVVVSPHLDDAVLSIGAAVAAWSRAGAGVEILTVLGCDPGSTALAGGWDRRGGFATEGEAARARREEDRGACAVLGATPVWLPFGSVDYERHGGEAEVRARVAEVVAGADVALAPGYPLAHPDHEWLLRTLAAGALGRRRLGLYAEQPYARRTGGGPRLPAWLEHAVDGTPGFEPVPVSFVARVAKWRAIRCYRSQLALLGMGRSLRRGPHVLAWRTESVAWADL
jgi:LmbE family N-acetylglucosaminyl deacetylase